MPRNPRPDVLWAHPQILQLQSPATSQNNMKTDKFFIPFLLCQLGDTWIDPLCHIKYTCKSGGFIDSDSFACPKWFQCYNSNCTGMCVYQSTGRAKRAHFIY